MNDTIYALSSATGIAGVSVIRISGPLSLDILKKLTSRQSYNARFAYFDTYSFNGEEIDTGLSLYFPSPNSFTGEDVVELQVHGSQAVLNKLFYVFDTLGLRLAKNGEFTRRAYENEKLDLLQAQGLLDLINSQTEAQRKLALHFQKGEASKQYLDLREIIIQAQSLMESSIDFSQDELPMDIKNQIKSRIIDAKNQISAILNNDIGQKIVNGFIISLIGEPNSGKSSLFNLLLGQNKAIVSDTAGTTRDVLEAVLDIDGYKVILSDTAGIRESENEIEKIGIQKALDLSVNADLKVYVVAQNLDKNLVDENTIVLYNKSDKIKHKKDSSLNVPQFIVSVKERVGINEFKDFLKKEVVKRLSSSNIYFTNSHHKNLLKTAYAYLEIAQSETQVDLKAENLKLAAYTLSEIVGTVSLNDLMDKIFSSFCIGK